MVDATLITAVGRALWGEAWKGPMAEAVRHPKSAVGDWARGRLAVPAGVWSELHALVRQRRRELKSLVPRIQRMHDDALERTVEQTRSHTV